MAGGADVDNDGGEPGKTPDPAAALPEPGEPLPSVGRKAALVLASQLLGSVLGYAILLVIGRYFDPSAYGSFLFALGALGLAGLLANAGFSEAHVHFVSRGTPLPAALGVYVRVRLALAAGLVLLVLLAGLLWFKVLGRTLTDATTVPILAAVLALQVLTVLRQLGADTWLGGERVNRVEVLKTLDTTVVVAVLAAIGLALAHSQGRWTPAGPLAPWLAETIGVGSWSVGDIGLALALAYVLGKLSSLLPAVAWWVRDRLRLGAWDGELARQYLRYALPIAAAGAMASLLAYTDVVLLGYLRTSHDVGQYGMAQKLASLCLVIATAVAMPLLPRFSLLLASGRSAEARATLHQAERALLLAAVPVAAALAALAPAVLHVAVGDRFLEASGPLRVLAVWAVVVAANTPATTKVMGSGRSRVVMVSSLICIVLNVPLNLWLVPDWGLGLGALGAALATLASTLVAAAYLRTVLRREFGIPLWDPVLVRIACAGAGAAVFWLLALERFGPHGFDRFWELAGWGVAGTLVFAGLAAVLGMLRRDDLRSLARMASAPNLWRELRGR